MPRSQNKAFRPPTFILPDSHMTLACKCTTYDPHPAQPTAKLSLSHRWLGCRHTIAFESVTVGFFDKRANNGRRRAVGRQGHCRGLCHGRTVHPRIVTGMVLQDKQAPSNGVQDTAFWKTASTRHRVFHALTGLFVLSRNKGCKRRRARKTEAFEAVAFVKRRWVGSLTVPLTDACLHLVLAPLAVCFSGRAIGPFGRQTWAIFRWGRRFG
jgi:hypothetical protein